MLVLSRKIQEAIIVGDTGGANQLLRIKVIEIKGSTVRLGFEASPEVAVHREEIWTRIRAETDALVPVQAAERPKEQVPYLN
jgi:carbon storage regulator